MKKYNTSHFRQSETYKNICGWEMADMFQNDKSSTTV